MKEKFMLLDGGKIFDISKIIGVEKTLYEDKSLNFYLENGNMIYLKFTDVLERDEVFEKIKNELLS